MHARWSGRRSPADRGVFSCPDRSRVHPSKESSSLEVQVNERPSIREILSDYLSEQDPTLAADNVALWQRPLYAALGFVHTYLLEDNDVEGSQTEIWPDIVQKRWFRKLYRAITIWYRTRFGDAFAEPAASVVRGLVLIWGTPFPIEVPTQIVRPAQPGLTVLLSFPESVTDSENPTDWLVSPPNIDQMPARELAKVSSECRKIASLLRSIKVKLLGIDHSNPVVSGFLGGVKVHIESASEHILGMRQEDSIPRAYWELQMACECAYKALLMQKTGTFQEIHDLFLLHDEAAKHKVILSRDLVKRIPRWRDMVSLRYGQAKSPTIVEFYEAYKVMLRIVEAALQPMVELVLGEASLLIGKAPWLHDDEAGRS